jgi:hypothetical protein
MASQDYPPRDERDYRDMFAENVCGLTHDVDSSYDVPLGHGATDMPLDKITCAQQVNMENVMEACATMKVLSENAIWYDTWPETIARIATLNLVQQFKPRNEWTSVEKLVTNRKEHAKMEYLVETGTLRFAKHGNFAERDSVERLYSKFFPVPKKGGVCRPIFDCRQQNDNMVKPPKFKLVKPADVIEILSFWKNPKVATMDYRQWFLELSLPEDVKHLFSFECGGVTYESNVYPMGMGHSPIVATTVTYASIVANAPAGYTFHAPGEDTEVPPPYIAVELQGELVAFVIAYLDNVFWCCKSNQVRDTLVKVAVANCKKERLNIEIKEPKAPEGQAARADRVEYFDNKGEILGIAYEIIVDKAVIEWRHAGIDKWQDVCDEQKQWVRQYEVGGIRPDVYVAARSLGRLVGIAVWDKVMKGEDLIDIADVIEMLASKGIGELKEKWRAKVQLSPTEQDLWKTTMERIMRNTPARKSTKPAKREKPELIASDASDNWWGVVWMREDGSTVHDSGEWTGEEKERSIFWKEVRAADICSDWFFNTLKGRHQSKSAAMAIDNRAAKACVSKWMSSNADARVLLRAWRARNVDQGITLTATWVGTLDQAADEPSRRRSMNSERVARCRALLLADEPVLSFIERIKTK